MSEKEHICMIAVQHSSMDDRIYFKQACSLKEAGYRVSILTSNVDGRPRDMSGLVLSEGLDQKGIGHYCQAEPSSIWQKALKKLFLGKYYSAMIRRAVSVDADLYVAHEAQSIKIALEAAEKRKAKVLFDSHESLCMSNWKDRIAKRRHLPRVQHFIAVNDMVAEDIRAIRPDAQISIVRNASIFPLSPISQQNPILICFEGKLSFDRGLREMCELFVETLERRKLPLAYKIIGSLPAEEQAYFDNYKKKHPVLNAVSFTGWVAYHELPNALAPGSIGLILNDNKGNNRYSSPNKLFNYIASGLCVLSTDLPMISQVIKEYSIGQTVSFGPGLSTRFADEIQKLIEQPEEFRALQSGILRAQKELAWEQEFQKMQGAVETLFSE